MTILKFIKSVHHFSNKWLNIFHSTLCIIIKLIFRRKTVNNAPCADKRRDYCHKLWKSHLKFLIAFYNGLFSNIGVSGITFIESKLRYKIFIVNVKMCFINKRRDARWIICIEAIRRVHNVKTAKYGWHDMFMCSS